MKINPLLLAFLTCGLCPVASAFSLDFTGVTVGTPTPITISVSGYGDVVFTSAVGSHEVDTFAPGATRAIAFDTDEALLVTFMGSAPTSTSFQSVGVLSGESFAITNPTPNEFLITFLSPDPNGTAGIQSIVFDAAGLPPTPPTAIPEPSISLLGALGATLLIIRRRK